MKLWLSLHWTLNLIPLGQTLCAAISQPPMKYLWDQANRLEAIVNLILRAVDAEGTLLILLGTMFSNIWMFEQLTFAKDG